MRPIAVGEIFYRIAAAIAVSRVLPKAKCLLSPYQYGVGNAEGCQRIIHTLQHELVRGSRRQAVLKVDITNAFNTVDRHLLLSSLYNTPSLRPLWRMAQFAYATSSSLLLQRSGSVAIPSSQGVRQGDPLGSLLFAFYIKDLLTDIAEQSGVVPYAYIDDVHLLGEPEQVLRAWELLSERLPSISLNLNSSKSSLAYFHQRSHPLPSTLVDTLTSAGVKVAYDWLPVLGAVVGASESDIIAGLHSRWKDV